MACFVTAQANTNEVVAASVVYLPAVNLDRPLSKAAWNSSHSLRHFSVLRKLDGQPFPAGAFCGQTCDKPAQMQGPK